MDNVDIISIHVKGKELCKSFIDERLQKESTISIWAPLKKAKLKGNKSSNTKAQYVNYIKLHQLDRRSMTCLEQ